MTALNPTQKSPERAFALQKYLLLHSQHDALQKHLNQVTAAVQESPTAFADRHRNSSVSSDSSNASDTSVSPHSAPMTASRSRRGSLPSSFGHMQHFHRENRINSLPAVIDETVVEEIEEDEQKLKDVNQQIKTTLTDLLNCESVRGDLRYRKWVQTRLMDTERELKESRSKSCERRRSVDMSL
ncbi:8be2d604-ffb2-4123-beb4-33026faccd47-CDS [Sclerotinia trifoliorum]|uniref:8be2d604-ffb2-4123-beb4-33026faccd47-CDS n=1 Tax=Sclerotinia trifoliorum TaxID=28548 RepID=A0A8H2VPV7_9HELO|nr:8be2d604-ffb2-4123-beb4-33026faccd47-CDS [Sclerotinia trifoliorum]